MPDHVDPQVARDRQRLVGRAVVDEDDLVDDVARDRGDRVGERLPLRSVPAARHRSSASRSSLKLTLSGDARGHVKLAQLHAAEQALGLPPVERPGAEVLGRLGAAGDPEGEALARARALEPGRHVTARKQSPEPTVVTGSSCSIRAA